MPRIIGIRFKNCGKIYDFEVNGVEIEKGDRVVVESEFGLSIGNVVIGPREIELPEKELKKVLRLANDDDLKQKEGNETFVKEAREFCLERIMARGLPMKLICAEVTLDRKRIIFYFTADGRIDFRELVKDLAAKFKTRIEMRQIGVRDKAKLIGGLGLCGKELCCRSFLTSFEPISIKMAKQQDLSLNAGKLSGICGRLMCCLGYEYNDSTADQIISRKSPISADEEELKDVEDHSICPEIPVSAAESSAESQSPPASANEGKPKTDEHKRHKRRRRRRFRKRVTKSE